MEQAGFGSRVLMGRWPALPSTSRSAVGLGLRPRMGQRFQQGERTKLGCAGFFLLRSQPLEDAAQGKAADERHSGEGTGNGAAAFRLKVMDRQPGADEVRTT